MIFYPPEGKKSCKIFSFPIDSCTPLYITGSKYKKKQIQWRFLRVFGIVVMIKRIGGASPTLQ